MPLLITVHDTFTVPPVTPVAGTDTAVTRRSGRSASVVTTVNEPGLRPAAEAVIEEVCTPSAIPSTTPVIVNVALAEPAGIVTVAGTVASDVSLLASVTTSAADVSVLRVTVPWMVLPSRTATLAAVTMSRAPSLSSTVKVAVAAPVSSVAPEVVVGRAVSTTERVPRATRSSGALIENWAEARFAGIVTVAGTASAEGFAVERVTTSGWSVITDRATVPMAAGLGCPSVTVVVVNERARLTTSSSVTTTLSEPLARPLAVASTVTRAAPSVSELFTDAMSNVAEVAPTGIVTVAGTRARVGVSLWRVTTSAAEVDVLRVTVPVVAGLAAFSATDAAARATVSRATSSSVAVRRADAPVKLVAEAVIVAVRLPSATALSTAVTGNDAEKEPAGMVTVAGTVTTPVSLDARVTTRSEAVLPLRVIVAVAAEAPAFSGNDDCDRLMRSAAATVVGAAWMPVLLAGMRS